MVERQTSFYFLLCCMFHFLPSDAETTARSLFRSFVRRQRAKRSTLEFFPRHRRESTTKFLFSFLSFVFFSLLLLPLLLLLLSSTFSFVRTSFLDLTKIESKSCRTHQEKLLWRTKIVENKFRSVVFPCWRMSHRWRKPSIDTYTSPSSKIATLPRTEIIIFRRLTPFEII